MNTQTTTTSDAEEFSNFLEQWDDSNRSKRRGRPGNSAATMAQSVFETLMFWSHHKGDTPCRTLFIVEYVTTKIPYYADRINSAPSEEEKERISKSIRCDVSNKIRDLCREEKIVKIGHGQYRIRTSQ